MTDKGAYTLLWKKYLPVIKILLKKTDDGAQKLQMYPHEFEKTGAKSKTGYVFTLQISNGRAVNNSIKKAAANDLFLVMIEDETLSEFLKGKDLRFSVGKNYEMTIQKEVKELQQQAV